MESDDFALMEGVQEGSPGAFERLVERYQRRLYRLAVGYLRNHEDALDAVQEAMVKIYLARSSYRPNAHPFTWAARILVNQCIGDRSHRRLRSPPSSSRRTSWSGVWRSRGRSSTSTTAARSW